MVWIPVGAWIGAGVLALVVLGVCAYEIAWKTRRLRGDLRRLQAVEQSVGTLRAELDVTRRRIAAARR